MNNEIFYTFAPVPRKLLAWYKKTARVLPWRENTDPYRIWLSEIMLQQTRVEAVIPYYERFLRSLPTVADLAAADDEVLHKLWEGLGYYSRVRNLKKAAGQVMERYDGKIPPSYELLHDLSGIGEYTAGAIASIAFGEAVPAVDGNVLRILSRLFGDESDITKPTVKKGYRELLMEMMPEDDPGGFNQALMDLGATVCLPNGAPKCLICPISENCRAHAAGSETSYPVKPPKKSRRVEERTVFLFVQEGRVLLGRREEAGLLAGLWEFPSKEGHLSPEEAGAFVEALGLKPKNITPLPAAKHIFTHIEWRMQGYLLEVSGGVAGYWANWKDILEEYTIPSAFAAYRKNFEQYLQNKPNIL